MLPAGLRNIILFPLADYHSAGQRPACPPLNRKTKIEWRNKMDKPLSAIFTTITYKLANGKRIRLDVTIEVKSLLEQADRQTRSQRRQERRRHTEYVDGLTDTTTVLPQEDFADLLYRMDGYKRLYDAIDTLTEIQRRRLYLHYFRGLTYRQIAELEGISYSTASDSVAQARKALRKLLTR
jgi:RNA polymerase sigma factor (sigma-70 family)